MTNLELARLFHDTYERMAPLFGYETRPETREFDPDSPNGELILAVVNEVRNHLQTQDEPKAPQIQEPFTVSELQVERICTAYESGYGRGQSKRDLSQPYRAGCAEAFAYYKGWLRGCQHQNRGEKP